MEEPFAFRDFSAGDYACIVFENSSEYSIPSKIYRRGYTWKSTVDEEFIWECCWCLLTRRSRPKQQNFGIKCPNYFHGTLTQPRCNGPRQLYTTPHDRHLCRPSCPFGNDLIENVKGPQAEKFERTFCKYLKSLACTQINFLRVLSIEGFKNALQSICWKELRHWGVMSAEFETFRFDHDQLRTQ